MYLPGIVGLLVLGFMLGRAWQKHSDGLWDYEQEVYEVGFQDGIHNRYDPHRKLVDVPYWRW